MISGATDVLISIIKLLPAESEQKLFVLMDIELLILLDLELHVLDVKIKMLQDVKHYKQVVSL